ncbi:hypothetical protein D3C81_1544430 [compost metagenome]
MLRAVADACGFAEAALQEAAGAGAGQHAHVVQRDRRAVGACQCGLADFQAGAAVLQQRQWTFLIGHPAVGPGLERDIGREKVTALAGQLVDMAAAALWRDAGQQAVRHQRLEPGTEDIGGDAQVAFELIEARAAVEGLAQHQDGPALTQHRHGAGDRARHRSEIGWGGHGLRASAGVLAFNLQVL